MLFQKSRRSFEAMVHAHSADLYRFAYWLCRNKAQAEDLVQETYTRAWANWQQVRDEKAAKGWLLTILHHEHARLYEKKRVEIDDDQALDQLLIASDSDVHAEVEMRDALWKLPESYREPLLLQVLGGFSCAEIGTMLGISETNVMQRLTRARQAMRKLIRPDRTQREFE
jgi:RNA polymerase sigma-70 factor, ECF subfamily